MTEGGYDSGVLTGMLANRGVDPAVVAMLNDRCRDGAWGADGGMLTLLLLVILMGGAGGFGWNRGNLDQYGVAGVDRTVVNEANYNRIMDAISTQGTRQEMAVQSLAQALNCDYNQVQAALAGVDKQLAVNQGSIINAVQSCCCTIQNKIDQCCCQTNLRLERVENHLQNELQQNRFLIQTNNDATRQLIIQQFCDQNAYLAAQFNDIRTREDQRQIRELQEKVQELRDNSNTALILNAIASFRQASPTTPSGGSTTTPS